MELSMLLKLFSGGWKGINRAPGIWPLGKYLEQKKHVPNDILVLCHGHGPSSDLCQDLLLSCDIGGAIWSQGWCIYLLNEELKHPRILKLTG